MLVLGYNNITLSVTDIWGFDTAAVTVLQNMEPPDSDKRLINKYAVLLSNSSELLRETTINVSCIRISVFLPAFFTCLSTNKMYAYLRYLPHLSQ